MVDQLAAQFFGQHVDGEDAGKLEFLHDFGALFFVMQGAEIAVSVVFAVYGILPRAVHGVRTQGGEQHHVVLAQALDVLQQALVVFVVDVGEHDD